AAGRAARAQAEHERKAQAAHVAAGEEAANRAAYAHKVAEAEARQAKAGKRQAERKKPAASALPPPQ
nr:protein TolA [Ramlibacter sp.]